MRSIHFTLSWALVALTAAGATHAQVKPQNKRPEKSDKMPAFSLVNATTNETATIQQLLAAGSPEVPMLLAFVHKDKSLCVRFVKELAAEVEGLGEARERCKVHMVFSGPDRSGEAVTEAKKLSAPFQLQWDPEHKAYQAMGMIAFPTVYLIDRKAQTIMTVRRGYKVSLAQEMVARLKVAMGLMTAAELQQILDPSDEVSTVDQQRRTRLREAQAFLRTGKAKVALEIFEGILREQPEHQGAIVGRALAVQKLGHKDAFDQLTAARGVAPEDHAVALALAEEFLKRNQLDKAEPLIRGALTARPAPAHFLLGALHEKREQWREAAQAYREAARQLLR